MLYMARLKTAVVVAAVAVAVVTGSGVAYRAMAEEKLTPPAVPPVSKQENTPSAAAQTAGQQVEETEIESTVLFKGSLYGDPIEAVFKSNEDWKGFLNRSGLAGALDARGNVDFDKHYVAVIGLGGKRNEAVMLTRIEACRIHQKGTDVFITYTKHGSGDMFGDNNAPMVILRFPRTDKRIHFSSSYKEDAGG